MEILIIGKDSYIGNAIDAWLSRRGWNVAQLDVQTDEWKTFDYSPFQAIVHVAGIVHQPRCNDWGLYKRVNTDMPVAIATMAKKQGVRQYVYLSTMAVYGREKELKPNVIDRQTALHADGMYGKSKLMAEEGLVKLQDEAFSVACVRPPSVYGKGCRGGYIAGFTSVVRRLPVFPQAYGEVKQSFIYIDNLAELIRQIIERQLSGAFCPQDDVAVNANELLRAIAGGINKKYRSSRFLGFFVELFGSVKIIKKAYGGVEYSRDLSTIEGTDYIVVPFEEGIRRTVAP